MSWTIETVVAMEVVPPNELRIDFDGNGEAHAGWIDGSGSAKQKHAWRNAGVWEVETVNATAYNGKFAVRDDLLVWAWIATASNGHDMELHITQATVGGSWSDAVVYTWVASFYDNGFIIRWETFEGDLDVGIDSSGVIHVLVCAGQTTRVVGHLAKWGKALYLNSSSWTPVEISSVGSGAYTQTPSCDELLGGRALAIDASDNVHCFWHEFEYTDSPNYDDLKYATSANSWTVETVHHDDDLSLAESYNMNLAVDNAGVAHVIYSLQEGGDSQYEYYDKQAWGSPQTLGWLTDDAGLLVPGEVWTCNDGTHSKLDFNVYGGAWRTEAIVASGSITQADIAIHPVDVQPWVAFGDSPNIKVAFRVREKPWWFLI